MVSTYQNVVPLHAIGACGMTGIMHQLELELGFLRNSGETGWNPKGGGQLGSELEQVQVVVQPRGQCLTFPLKAADALWPETNLRKPILQPKNRRASISLSRSSFCQSETWNETSSSRPINRPPAIVALSARLTTTSQSLQSTEPPSLTSAPPSISSHSEVTVTAAWQYSMSTSA